MLRPAQGIDSALAESDAWFLMVEELIGEKTSRPAK
jgi:hypothetical protein